MDIGTLHIKVDNYKTIDVEAVITAGLVFEGATLEIRIAGKVCDDGDRCLIRVRCITDEDDTEQWSKTITIMPDGSIT